LHKSLFDGQPVVVLRQKGCDGIEEASIARESELRTVVGQSVHVKCRQEYTNPLIIESYRKKTANDSEVVDKHVLHSSGVFDYKTNCIFCSCADPYDGKKSEFRLIPGRTLELRNTILQACERYNNEWVNTVKPCVLFVSDMPAADVVYHEQCSVNFYTGKQMPQTFARRQSDGASAAKCPRLTGRPKDKVRKEVFLQVIKYLEENDDKQITIEDLIISHMRSVSAEENCEPYSFPYMKSQLLEHFGDRIIIAEVNGKPNVVRPHHICLAYRCDLLLAMFMVCESVRWSRGCIVAKRLDRSRCRLACGVGWATVTMY